MNKSRFMVLTSLNREPAAKEWLRANSYFPELYPVNELAHYAWGSPGREAQGDQHYDRIGPVLNSNAAQLKRAFGMGKGPLKSSNLLALVLNGLGVAWHYPFHFTQKKGRLKKLEENRERKKRENVGCRLSISVGGAAVGSTERHDHVAVAPTDTVNGPESAGSDTLPSRHPPPAPPSTWPPPPPGPAWWAIEVLT